MIVKNKDELIFQSSEYGQSIAKQWLDAEDKNGIPPSTFTTTDGSIVFCYSSLDFGHCKAYLLRIFCAKNMEFNCLAIFVYHAKHAEHDWDIGIQWYDINPENPFIAYQSWLKARLEWFSNWAIDRLFEEPGA